MGAERLRKAPAENPKGMDASARKPIGKNMQVELSLKKSAYENASESLF